MANQNLGAAKKAKNDEFYTQYHDIEKEMNAYLDYNQEVFKDKTLLLPCDDPEWSNFTKYFAQNFERLGLKKLISTSYAPNSKPAEIVFQPTLFETEDPKFDSTKTRVKGKIFSLTRDANKDGVINFDDIEWQYLDGDGDFRSDEVTRLRDESDLVITNPPFSLFREFFTWVRQGKKDFVLIGNMNALAYKEIFPHIKNNEVWLGATGFMTDMVFRVPNGFEVSSSDREKAAKLGYVGNYTRLGNSAWFTTLDHGRRHQPIQLMTESENIKFSKHKEIKGVGYLKYDNYDAIEVPWVDGIPSDYAGVLGVPLSFLGKYSPDQFDIIGTSANGLVDEQFKLTQGLSEKFVEDYYREGGTGAYKAGNPTAGLYKDGAARMIYQRIFIKHKRTNSEN